MKINITLQDRNRAAISWISNARGKRIIRAYPELDGWITEDKGTGGKCGGSYACNSANRLRMAGEHRLADLLLVAATEIR